MINNVISIINPPIISNMFLNYLLLFIILLYLSDKLNNLSFYITLLFIEGANKFNLTFNMQTVKTIIIMVNFMKVYKWQIFLFLFKKLLLVFFIID